MKYRSEIDGLRAVAVLVVILSHAGFEALSGGFVGVDIFFVISGYLITTIIIEQKEKGSFSLLNFYERRARRILPALLVVMLACIPVAFLWMLPDDLENFGQSLVATTFFSNNILLYLTSNYFALASEFKPLLHTWSLGVEEQYYIIFPLLIIALWRFGLRRIFVILAVIGLASLTYSTWVIPHKPAAAFYLLQSRAWELMIGAAIAIYLFKRPPQESTKPFAQVISNTASLAGLAMICTSAFFFTEATPFPGIAALLPTVGTGLIILYARDRTLVGTLLRTNILVWIGLVSYSAYLWHQPLFAFARLYSLDEPSKIVFITLTGATLALSYLTWKYVEQPFRHKRVSLRPFLAYSAMATILVSGTGFLIHLNSGFVNRWGELSTEVQDGDRRLNAAYNHRINRLKYAPFNDSRKTHVLVLGNSFARDFINAGMENDVFSNSEISYVDSFPTCIKDAKEVSDELRLRIGISDYMIFGSPTISTKCWREDFEIFKALGARNIVVIGTKNFGWNMNAVMHLPPNERERYRAKVLPEIMRENAEMAQAVSSDYFVNVLSMITDKDGRVAVFTEEGKLISQDRSHLTRAGAKYLGKILFTHPLLKDISHSLPKSGVWPPPAQ